MVFKGCSYVGAFLCGLCLPSAFGGRTGFDVNTNYIFPQGVLATVTLVGRVAGDGEARACAGCEAGLPLCSVTVTTLSAVDSALKLLEWKL